MADDLKLPPEAVPFGLRECDRLAVTTGAKYRSGWLHAEAVMVEVGELSDIGRKDGTRSLRFSGSVPEPDMDKEATLQPKIESKMQVSTFLAGFTFTALITALTQDGYWLPSQPTTAKALAVAAIILLT